MRYAHATRTAFSFTASFAPLAPQASNPSLGGKLSQKSGVGSREQGAQLTADS
ncbi:MAG: hypothetical protein F6K26_33280 [Moorea sp. SIO2I5]|nr:hypothetical protein [Moorena sp. SIO2I5]